MFLRRAKTVIWAAIAVSSLGAAAGVAQDANGFAAKGMVKAPGGWIHTNQYGVDFKAPESKTAWLKRREEVRRQILVSTGLYPLPKRTPMSPQIYGKLERDGYTIEKVVLETQPGLFLSGNLYRPSTRKGRKTPGILNPHGHWGNGRFDPEVQARLIGQARRGATALIYDMVGFQDGNPPFSHAFFDDGLFAIGKNLPGLQLWNSMRAMDFLVSLPEVDSNRIACTGASGGGTQTFLLSAVDDRVKVAAPVNMISHHAQGGCQCENSPLLRIGTDNVEFGALFAPKPLMLVGATGDWTSQILQRGYPEIKAVYRLYGKEDNVEAVVHNLPHNYAQLSRESVYTFFEKHLWGEKNPAPVREKPWSAETVKTLSTWDSSHPRPTSAKTPAQMEKYLTEQAKDQVETWAPATAEQWRDSREIIRNGLRVALKLNPMDEGLAVSGGARVGEGTTHIINHGGRATHAVYFPALDPARAKGVTVIAHPRGSAALKEGLQATVDQLRTSGQSVTLVEPFMAGATPEEIARRQSASFYSTYNKTVLAERVQDIINTCVYVDEPGRRNSVSLIGIGAAGPWVTLALPYVKNIRRAVVDANGFEFSTSMPMSSEMALPHALRYGGIKAYLALAAPTRLLVHNTGGVDTSWARRAYALHGAPDKLSVSEARSEPMDAANRSWNGRRIPGRKPGRG